MGLINGLKTETEEILETTEATLKDIGLKEGSVALLYKKVLIKIRLSAMLNLYNSYNEELVVPVDTPLAILAIRLQNAGCRPHNSHN